MYVSLILKSLCKKWDIFLYMGLLGTKTSFSFVRCVSDRPQYALRNNDVTRIFCEKCFPTLFNISTTIMAVRKVREVFVDGSLKNINLLYFCKMHLLLITIVSTKQWIKHEISAKMSLLVLFSYFNLTVLLTIFTFTLDKLHCCWWKCFHLYLPFTASMFTFNFYLDCSVTLF